MAKKIKFQIPAEDLAGFTARLSDNIEIEYDFMKQTATVWNADGDYDAVYGINDLKGIETEIAFIRASIAKETN